MATLSVRDARREDCKEVRRLIQELADFEKMPDGPRIDEKDLERDSFDVKPPLFYCYVVDDPNDSSKLIGYAIYFYAYGALTGRKMYLEDIYVTETFRGKGVGHMLFQKVVQKGVEMKCVDMDFVVLDWNPAQDFYKARGARDITEEGSWHLYHLGNDCLKTLTGKSK
ncbi:diamine acetyltransferase 2-like isoform X2 [Thrips palmi]|nr:diamine acetyltransferase 2-like isoform X2 [Thrips palmi]